MDRINKALIGVIFALVAVITLGITSILYAL
jgi:hypothetical protein